jgi:hypothetical protein
MSKKQNRIKKLILLRENLGMGTIYPTQPQQVIFLGHNVKRLQAICDELLIADGVHDMMPISKSLKNPFFQQGNKS